MINLLWPWALLLLPLPLAAYHGLPRAPSREASLYVPFFRQLRRLESSAELSRRRSLLVGVLGLIWVLLVLALSRPQWVGDPIELPVTGRDLMLIVDVSGSMEAQDMQVGGQRANRLDVTKSVVTDFVERRQGDRLGLILFAARAYTQSPLTFDRPTVGTLLDEAHIGIVEENATAIGDALALAVRHLRERPVESRIAILLTDGVNNAGRLTPLEAGELALRSDVRVYTIGIGADTSSPGGMFGARSINPSADLDEETLTHIATSTGGRFFRARDQRELEQIYELLDTLEPVEQEGQTYRPITSLFYLPLSIALLLSLLLAVAKIPWRAVLAEGRQLAAPTLAKEKS